MLVFQIKIVFLQEIMPMRYYAPILLLLIAILPIRSATKRALLIGISDYPIHKTVENVGWQNIHGANDIVLIGKTLASQKFKVSQLTNADATASKIRRALYKLQSDVKSGDIVYLHFSCHGQPVEDLDGDEKDGWDESIVPYDAWKKPISGIYDGKNHILDDELNKIIGRIREKAGTNGFVYVIIDACHSGGIDRGEEEDEMIFCRGTDSGFSLTNKAYVPRMDTRSNIPMQFVEGWANVCMLEACRSYQSNHEIKMDGTYYGPLSYYIYQSLLSHQLSSDTNWIMTVKKKMDNNPKLVNQNMVIQTTIKQ